MTALHNWHIIANLETNSKLDFDVKLSHKFN